MSSVTVILPAHNEEKAIGSVVLSAKQNSDRVIVIDHASNDRTAEIAEIAGAEVIQLSLNSGEHLCIKKGIEKANDSDFIVTMDILTCHDPDLIKKMVAPLKNDGYDLVVGTCVGKRVKNEERSDSTKRERKLNRPLAFMACSGRCPDSMDMGHIYGRSANHMIALAREKGFKAKYMDVEQESISERFHGYSIGVVVPAYNEELLIEETIRGIPEYVDSIYVIDDCSTDRTPDIIKEMKDPRIVSLRHEVNKGVGASIIDGYKMALEDRMDIVAVMAGDNQMDPDQLPRLLMPIVRGEADYTKGNRLISDELRKGMSKWRAFGNLMLSMLTKIGSGYWSIMDPQNGYSAISRKALKTLDLDSVYPYYGYCNDLLVKLNTFNMRVKDVVMPARYGRETSSISYGKYMSKVAPMLFRGFLWRLKMKYMVYEFHPLVLFYMTSMVLIPSGFIFGVWIMLQNILHNPVSPNYLLLDMLIILMGVQLLLFAMFFDMQAEMTGKSSLPEMDNYQEYHHNKPDHI